MSTFNPSPRTLDFLRSFTFARTHVSCYCGDSRTFVLVRSGTPIATTVCFGPCPMPHHVYFVRLRGIPSGGRPWKSFLLPHHSAAKKTTKPINTENGILFSCVIAEDARAPLRRAPTPYISTLPPFPPASRDARI